MTNPINFENLSESELINVLVENTPVAYLIIDNNYRIYYANDYFLKLRNLKREDTIGNLCYNLSNGGTPCSVCAVAGALETGEKQKVLRKDILPDGSFRYMDEYAIPLFRGKSGNLTKEYILEIMVNRTEEMGYRVQLDKDFNEMVKALITMLDAKDEYTATHSQNVRKMSVKLGNAMKLDSNTLFDIEIAASLHDIGKISIPYSIINKPGSLTDSEFSIIKKHSTNSFDILKDLSGFSSVKEIVRHHHERWDGGGYPNGLKGEEIPLGARIISIADTYDAMTSTRSYRKALSHETALEEIRKNAGTQFDPKIAEIFINLTFNTGRTERLLMGKKEILQLQLERQLLKASKQQTLPPQPIRDIRKIIPDGRFMAEIFANTPVAYVVMDNEHKIIYASEYFHKLMGIEEEYIKGQKCYDVTNRGKKCRDCAVLRAQKSNKLEFEQITKITPGGIKYLDTYAISMPGLDNKKYLIQIIMDRTEEKQLQVQHEQDFYNLVEMLSGLLEYNTQSSSVISNNIKKLCSNIAVSLGLNKQQIQEISIGSVLCNIGMIALHDIGKAPEEILKKHPQIAYEMLHSISGFENVKEIVLHHHERWDGGGYPKGLSHEEIPLGARIVAVADAYSHLAVDLNQEAALERIREESGKMFDPMIVNALVDIKSNRQRMSTGIS